jgi:2-dehydropantoate 2-reductase
MRYIIYGAGAIGGSIGARLFQHGHDVILICRGPHLEAVQRHGLTLRTPDETVTLPIPAAGHPSEIAFRADDVVLLAVKSQHTAGALDDLGSAAGDVPVVCAQNGVANERMALRRFSRVYAMLVVLPATHLEPGEVLLNSAPVGGVLDAGRYPGGVDSLIEQLTADLSASGFSARPDPNIMRLKYAKLLNNIANAVQALCGHDAAAGDLVRAVRSEAIACYDAAGIDYTPPAEFRERVADVRDGQIAGQSRGGGSSWQSLARGAGSIETDFLNGEIALLGALHGVPTPYNRMLQSAAHEAVRDGKPAGSYDVEQLMARARDLVVIDAV